MYYIYMLRCEDNSIYTGITTNVERRLEEHISKDKKCAKYTLSHNAMKLEAVWETENKSLASKLEYRIKHLSKAEKEGLINSKKLEKYLSEKIECNMYKNYNTLNKKNEKRQKYKINKEIKRKH